MYQDLYDKEKIVKKDVSMKFYDMAKPLYLETNACSISLGAGLLQVGAGMNGGHDQKPDNEILHPIAFVSKSLSSAE